MDPKSPAFETIVTGMARTLISLGALSFTAFESLNSDGDKIHDGTILLTVSDMSDASIHLNTLTESGKVVG